MIKKIKFFGVEQIGNDFGTLNLNPGKKVYGERLVKHENKEYRIWDFRRSKLAAAIKLGLKKFPFDENSKILYLGAGNGTTVSHISDICISGLIYSVEFSARAMIDLFLLSEKRENIVPILADANKPFEYAPIVSQTDIIYQDIAQREQVDILNKNINFFLKDSGYIFLMVKARSIDVNMEPKRVFHIVLSQLKERYKILEQIRLDPYEKDHMCILAQKA